MSGIFQGDVFIKLAIELGIEDMRRNDWLIDHMLSDLKNITYASDKYGQKQIDSCKEWFLNNQIDMYLRGRDDKDRLPCVTIQLGPSNEKKEMKLMADQSTETKILMPKDISKPIPYVIKPFIPTGYDQYTGIISTPSSVDLTKVATGMILVNPTNGNGYSILDVGDNELQIESNLDIEASQFGILPQFQHYEARVEHAFFDETYSIGCHAHGDAQNLLFLWSIVKYSILRYRESLLEANGFAESSISSAGPDFDQSFTTDGGEKAWARFMTLNGQIENSWIKSPRRVIEVAALKKNINNGYVGGISIISNETSDLTEKANSVWWTDTIEEVNAEEAAMAAEEAEEDNE